MQIKYEYISSRQCFLYMILFYTFVIFYTKYMQHVCINDDSNFELYGK